MQLLLNIPNSLQQRVIPLAQATNETTEQLALRLLQEKRIRARNLMNDK